MVQKRRAGNQKGFTQAEIRDWFRTLEVDTSAEVRNRAMMDIESLHGLLSPEAYSEARDTMNETLAYYDDNDFPSLNVIRKDFLYEMRSNHEDFGPDWGRVGDLDLIIGMRPTERPKNSGYSNHELKPRM